MCAGRCGVAVQRAADLGVSDRPAPGGTVHLRAKAALQSATLWYLGSSSRSLRNPGSCRPLWSDSEWEESLEICEGGCRDLLYVGVSVCMYIVHIHTTLVSRGDGQDPTVQIFEQTAVAKSDSMSVSGGTGTLNGCLQTVRWVSLCL